MSIVRGGGKDESGTRKYWRGGREGMKVIKEIVEGRRRGERKE